jgi:undecaprenyl-diphosphatase
MVNSPGQTALLGVLQGLTEFLPVSSSGHLALAEILFDVEGGGLSLNVMLHAGTLLATVVIMRRTVATMLAQGLPALLKPSQLRSNPGGRDIVVVLLATLPTAMIGLATRDLVERWTSSPLIVGLGFLVTALLLVSTRWVRPGESEVPKAVGAVLLGIAQGLAVLPGISRSGATITAALWLGVRPDRAFELSMLLSLPAIIGAVALELPRLAGSDGGLALALLGAALAFISGLGALLALRKLVIGGHFSLFCLWVFPIAVATLALARAWPTVG